MDVMRWSEDDMRRWAAKSDADRIADVKREYTEAKSVKAGFLNKSAWQSANRNFTRLALIDAQIRATNAADAVERAIKLNQMHGETVKKMVREQGADLLPRAVFGLVYESISTEFDRHNWRGSGVDANEQVMRMVQVVEYLEKFIISYVQEPADGRPSGIYDDFLPNVEEARKRVIQKAFQTSSGAQFDPLGQVEGR